MKISSKTDYALRTVLDLAIHKEDGVTHLADIAERQNIPVKFLEQILLQLKGAGIAASKRGVNGGYFLAIAPSKITLAAIVSLTDDSLSSTDALKKSAAKLSGKDRRCPFREVWADIEGYVAERLEGATIEDMCNRARELSGKNIPDYAI